MPLNKIDKPLVVYIFLGNVILSKIIFFLHHIVWVKYLINSAKAVVGVDRPYLCIYKSHIRGTFSKFSWQSFCQKKMGRGDY